MRFEGNNGRVCEFDKASVTVSEVLSELGAAKKALAGKLDGELLDLVSTHRKRVAALYRAVHDAETRRARGNH